MGNVQKSNGKGNHPAPFLSPQGDIHKMYVGILLMLLIYFTIVGLTRSKMWERRVISTFSPRQFLLKSIQCCQKVAGKYGDPNSVCKDIGKWLLLQFLYKFQICVLKFSYKVTQPRRPGTQPACNRYNVQGQITLFTFVIHSQIKMHQ